FAQYQMNGHEIGTTKEVVFVDASGAKRSGMFGSQIFAPGDHVHMKRFANPRDFAAELAQAKYSEGLSAQAGSDRRLPCSLAHLFRFVGNMARQSNQQSPGQLGRRRREHARSADDDT